MYTDVELAILSCCAYYQLKNTQKPTRLYDFLNNIKSSLYEYLGEQYTASLDLLYKKSEVDDSMIIAQRNDKLGTGFAAFAVKSEDNTLTIIPRGTEDIDRSESCKKDIKADLQLMYRYCTDQQAAMREFMESLCVSKYSGCCFAGHSLGGNLSMFGAIRCIDPEKVINCVTFNAPGFNKSFCKKYADRISGVEGKIRNYQNECDGVSNAFAPLGELIILECMGLDSFFGGGFSAHFVNRLLIENGEFKRNRTGGKDLTFCGAIVDIVTVITDNLAKPKDEC